LPTDPAVVFALKYSKKRLVENTRLLVLFGGLALILWGAFDLVAIPLILALFAVPVALAVVFHACRLFLLNRSKPGPDKLSQHEQRLKELSPNEIALEVSKFGFSFKLITDDTERDVGRLHKVLGDGDSFKTKLSEYRAWMIDEYPELADEIRVASICGMEFEHENSVLVSFDGPIGDAMFVRFDGTEFVPFP
jgi:hypothetical protein